jgi:NAD(P)-dependent dehydrogenase (short-subunit alcohol dehydrogenase family)
VKAIVTGGASGIGAAIVARLAVEGLDVESLDLVDGFDVSDPGHWERVGPVEVACLNAGVVGGSPDPAELDVDAYRRALAVNVDGVVLGVRRLARVMPSGGQIVVTASLAGLVGMPEDPVYALSKHAVVGYVRSVAPALERHAVAINAVCPGIADTPMLSGAIRERLVDADFPLLAAAQVADAVWLALGSGLSGRAWVVQPGREPVDFRFPNVPGPRSAGGGTVGAPPYLGASRP